MSLVLRHLVLGAALAVLARASLLDAPGSLQQIPVGLRLFADQVTASLPRAEASAAIDDLARLPPFVDSVEALLRLGARGAPPGNLDSAIAAACRLGLVRRNFALPTAPGGAQRTLLADWLASGAKHLLHRACAETGGVGFGFRRPGPGAGPRGGARGFGRAGRARGEGVSMRSEW
jgi:hypothetical protein